jgi:hypothetical protein
MGRNSSGMPFHASLFSDTNGTTGIWSSDVNLCILAAWAAASVSGVLADGVGDRMNSRDIEGSDQVRWEALKKTIPFASFSASAFMDVRVAGVVIVG